jgi:hypothetical protein
MTATASIATAKDNIHTLPLAQRNTLYREEYRAKSYVQDIYSSDAVDLPIGDFGARLRSEVMRLLAAKGLIKGNEVLEELHQHIPQELKDYNFNDGVNKISTYLYDTDEPFTALYLQFIKECVAKHFTMPFYFQATPTIRLHCPEGKHNDHYPRYHTDIGYGHPPQEINIWIPLTEAMGEQQHGFRRMSVADSATLLDGFDYDFTPFIDKAINDKNFNAALNTQSPQVATPLSQMHAFDSRCIHTGEPLLAHTRASIDIRIIPVTDYDAMPVIYQGTGRRRILYAPGECYYTASSDQL